MTNPAFAKEEAECRERFFSGAAIGGGGRSFYNFALFDAVEDAALHPAFNIVFKFKQAKRLAAAFDFGDDAVFGTGDDVGIKAVFFIDVVFAWFGNQRIAGVGQEIFAHPGYRPFIIFYFAPLVIFGNDFYRVVLLLVNPFYRVADIGAGTGVYLVGAHGDKTRFVRV